MCMGERIHKLRIQKGLKYSDIYQLTKIPPNILKSCEVHHLDLYPNEIKRLAKCFDMSYIDMCTSWEEVYKCLYNDMDDVYAFIPHNMRVKYRRDGLYSPFYMDVEPEHYKIRIIASMDNRFNKMLLGVPIKVKGIAQRARLDKADCHVTLFELCNSSFRNNIKLSYILSGMSTL